MAVVQSYIERDDKTGLAEYIDLYQTQPPPDTRERYCRNDVVNAIVCYYMALARDNGIEFEEGIDYPEGCPVSDTDRSCLYFQSKIKDYINKSKLFAFTERSHRNVTEQTVGERYVSPSG